jgi:hypothetical protein
LCSKGSTGNWKPPNEQSIADLLPSGSRVGRDDIIVTSLRLNLTAGNSNPLDNVSFFDMYESTEKRVLKHSDMTALQLQNHEVNTLFPSQSVVSQSKSALEGKCMHAWQDSRCNISSCQCRAAITTSYSVANKSAATHAFLVSLPPKWQLLCRSTNSEYIPRRVTARAAMMCKKRSRGTSRSISRTRRLWARRASNLPAISFPTAVWQITAKRGSSYSDLHRNKTEDFRPSIYPDALLIS